MLQRRLSLLQAVSLNMAMMVGIGPFITIPALVGAMGGPQALVGWVLGAILALADGLVWSELAAAFPGSGGTYHFFDAVYGESRVGRLLKFLFVWQFLFSAPLELASGAIGMSRYLSYFWTDLKVPLARWTIGSTSAGPLVWELYRYQVLAMLVMVGLVALAYRRIEAAGRLMVVLWVGMVVTVCWMIAAGLLRFDPKLAWDIPPTAWTIDRTFAIGLGLALANATYCYLGYYQVCYLGDEVTNPVRTIPRSILISVAAVSVAYLLMNVSILGVIPWREVIPSHHIATDFMLRLHGRWAALAVTLLIVWTAAAGTFAALLSYSRVPYAAAASGHFFQGLARTHPTGQFPHRSLLLVGGVATVACLADLEAVILALLTSRILIQFVGQCLTLIYIHANPQLRQSLPFRMPAFPLPVIVAIIGWVFVFGMSGERYLLYGLVSLVLGIMVFLVWSRLSQTTRLDQVQGG